MTKKIGKLQMITMPYSVIEYLITTIDIKLKRQEYPNDNNFIENSGVKVIIFGSMYRKTRLYLVNEMDSKTIFSMRYDVLEQIIIGLFRNPSEVIEIIIDSDMTIDNSMLKYLQTVTKEKIDIEELVNAKCQKSELQNQATSSESKPHQSFLNRRDMINNYFG